MNVAVFGRKIVKAHLPVFNEFLLNAERFGWKVIFEKELLEHLVTKFDFPSKFEVFSSSRDFAKGIDLMLSFGGDGTFIQAVKYVRNSQVPIMGINLGRLGFLANNSKDVLEETMQKVYERKFIYQKRSLLSVHTHDNLFGEDNFALNELTLHKKDTSSMITVHAYIDNMYLNSYWADGLIIATPTGSTAYNLSCNGPIVTPGCQIHILTPIAPHNLNVRPVVVPDHLPIKLNVEGRDRKYLLSMDGCSKSIKQGEDITITKADFMINVLRFEDNNFLDTIRNKMMWGLDRRN